MFSSPFQQPSPRQNVLASQIQDAQRLGNERQLVLLSGQWVHRFGLDSLPVIDAASPEAEAESFDQLQPASVLATLLSQPLLSQLLPSLRNWLTLKI